MRQCHAGFWAIHSEKQPHLTECVSANGIAWLKEKKWKKFEIVKKMQDEAYIFIEVTISINLQGSFRRLMLRLSF